MQPVPIVVVDDDPRDRRVIRTQIEDLVDNQFTYLSRGEELLVRLHTGQIERPGLILIDLVLPGMSGFELIKEIREHHKYLDRTQLVVLSRSDDKESENTARMLGAAGYIIKPITIFSFMHVVRNMKPRRFRLEIHDRGPEH
jgi:CheY-like chemotaxis protein